MSSDARLTAGSQPGLALRLQTRGSLQQGNNQRHVRKIPRSEQERVVAFIRDDFPRTSGKRTPAPSGISRAQPLPFLLSSRASCIVDVSNRLRHGVLWQQVVHDLTIQIFAYAKPHSGGFLLTKLQTRHRIKTECASFNAIRFLIHRQQY